MHILHLAPYYAPAYSFGGVVSMLEGLAQAQVAQGHQVTVLTSDALSLDTRYRGQYDEILDGVRVIRCRNWVYQLRRYNLNTPFGMASIAETIMPNVDIVHLHEFRTIENLLLVPVAARHHKPIVLSPHGTLTYSTGRSRLKSFWDQWLSPRITPHIHHVIALAASEKDDVQQTWSQFDRDIDIRVIPNGVNLAPYQHLPNSDAFREKYGLGDAQVILFMGRLHQRKGVDVLAQAFQQANLPNTKLLFVGPDEGMQATIKALDNEHIILTGFLEGDDRLAAFASADLFVLPAIGEGLSMAALEAMASGIPVLLSEGCNLPEAVSAGAGYIIPIDAAEIADSLVNVLADTGKLSQMGRNAQQLIAEQFTWDTIAQQMIKYYKNLSTP
ncbi:MAG: glycosyltransferase [Phototrophicaceae bacterium]